MPLAGVAMSRRKLAWIAVVFVGVLAIGGLLSSVFRTSKLAFTEPEIQERLNQQLPKTVRGVTVERVTAHLAENSLALRIDIQGTVMRRPVAAVVSAQGVPRYESDRAELYFDADDVRIDQLTIAGRTVIGADDTAARSSMLEAAGPAVQRIADAAIKAYLATRPVYRFKNDFKGFVLKASLVGVAVNQNALVVTFSLWNLTVTCAIYASVLIGILLIGYLLIRHPLWGLETVIDIATTTMTPSG
jgi:hypothetical protein